MIQRQLPLDLDASSQRLPGLTHQQQQLLQLIGQWSGDTGQWTGSQPQLATAIGVSRATVGRYVLVLRERGLIETIPTGKVLTYRLLASAVAKVAGANGRSVAAETLGEFRYPARSETRQEFRSSTEPAPTKKRKRWWQRPDADQLDLFQPVATRAEVAQQLVATTVHWMGLLVSLVIGPAATSRKPAAAGQATEDFGASEVTQPRSTSGNHAQAPVAPAANQLHQPVATTLKPASTPAATASNQSQTSVNQSQPVASSPIAIELLPTPISQPSVQRPITPTATNRALKFKLWTNAKDEDFRDEKNVQEVFQRAVQAGICSEDSRLLLFKYVASAVRNKQPSHNLAKMITARLRGTTKGTIGPWRAEGSAADEQTARDQIRRLDRATRPSPVASSFGVPCDRQPLDDKKRADIARLMQEFPNLT